MLLPTLMLTSKLDLLDTGTNENEGGRSFTGTGVKCSNSLPPEPCNIISSCILFLRLC